VVQWFQQELTFNEPRRQAMKTFAKLAVIGLAVAGVGLGAAAYARGPGGMYGPGAGMHGPQGFGAHGAMAEARLDAIKGELKLTDAQAPAWAAFESAVRDQATAMTAAREAMHASRDNPDAHIALMESRLEGMKTVLKARGALYDVLTAEQQAVLDRAGPAGMPGYRR
jgi:Spy/CpxP family protein refolding chaperone